MLGHTRGCYRNFFPISLLSPLEPAPGAPQLAFHSTSELSESNNHRAANLTGGDPPPSGCPGPRKVQPRAGPRGQRGRPVGPPAGPRGKSPSQAWLGMAPRTRWISDSEDQRDSSPNWTGGTQGRRGVGPRSQLPPHCQGGVAVPSPTGRIEAEAWP
jgi:hypothetical protein